MTSVIIPSKSRHLLEKCLDSLAKQTKKHETIVVVPKGSAFRRKGVTVVEENTGTRAGACNAGARHAKGKIIVFTDDDCTFPEDWLEKIEKAIQNVDVAGGDDIQKDGTYFQRALYQIDLAKNFSGCPEHRLRGCNTAYKVFPKEQFDPKMTGIEETEFHHRLARKGYKLKFDPSIIVYHDRRNGFRPLFKRLYTNGISRMQLIKKDKSFAGMMDIIAPLAVMITLFSFASYLINPLYTALWLSLLVLYFLLKPVAIVLRTKNVKYYPILVPITAVREFAFGLGILRGFFRKSL
ncbi:MAG: glycosyltransferase [Candidatus Aenigmarchaeota archaeon]|nr:glycosyltransferase [Candidatus Aenigmarchaeota archaeon]